ncbi:MAG: 4-hydroxy-tetrahydrodipicolinate synthase [Clostridia bacterium]|nr:4-hydroxy-tetrahydrodipicolinate synthase [Clostridia bacterium]
MKKCVFKGCGTALVTPFSKDNKIDYNALDKLIDFQLEGNIDALIIFGTTGEASTLTDDEKATMAKFVLKKVNGKIPVIAGAGSNNTFRAIELSKLLESSGVDALLHVTPYYNKTNEEGLIRHFTAVANSTNLPVILYNVPSRTGMNISPCACGELANVSNICGIKEASGDLRVIGPIHSKAGEDFAVYAGNDDVILPTLACGGVGVISVLSNILPVQVSEICNSFLGGDINKTRTLTSKYARLISLLFCETNPIPIKYALSLTGHCNDYTRLPLWNMSEANKELLKREMEFLEII